MAAGPILTEGINPRKPNADKVQRRAVIETSNAATTERKLRPQRMRSLSVRLKSFANSFCEWKAYGNGRKHAAGFEGLRLFGTSNGCHLKEPIGIRLQEILESLQLGETPRASLLLSELGSGDQAIARDFISILQYCARTPDPLFAMETWKTMGKMDIMINAKCYFLTLRALCKGGYLEEAFKMLNIQGENSKLYPTLPVYNNILEACIQMNSLNHASECLYLMKQQGVGKNAITYCLLLKLAVLQKNLQAAHEIWKEFVNYYSPSIITLRKFIWSFTRLGDLESAYIALQQMVALSLQHDVRLTKTTEGKILDPSFDIPIPFRDELSQKRYRKDIHTSTSTSIYHQENDSHYGIKSELKETEPDGLILSEQPFPRPVVKLLRWSFNDMIHACANSKNDQLAEELMLQMQNLGLEPSCGTYDGFVRALVSVRSFGDGIEALKTMLQNSMKPYDSTLAVLSVSCSRRLNLDLAEWFLGQISKCDRVYPFNAFLEACDTLDQHERVDSLLEKMKSLRIPRDIRTYELLFSLVVNVNAPSEDGKSQADIGKKIEEIENDMRRDGIQHSHLSIKYLLKALGMKRMTQEMIQYLRIAENQFSYRNTPLGTDIYNTVLHSLVEAKESDKAIQIFKSMISCGLSPNAATYNIMIDLCNIIKCFSSACALIGMMIRDGFSLHPVTYTALIKILLNDEDFEEAIALVDQASLEGMQPDVMLYNTILQVASEKGRIDVTEMIVEQMHQERIQPDPSTCSHVLSAYVDNGFYSTGMEALQVLCMRMIAEQQDTLEEFRLEYESHIFDEDLEAESKIIEIFKDTPYLAVAILCLRWCATLTFPISWSPNQSPWAKRLANDYSSRSCSHSIQYG